MERRRRLLSLVAGMLLGALAAGLLLALSPVASIRLPSAGSAQAQGAPWPLETDGPQGCWHLHLTRESPQIPLQAHPDDATDEGARLAILAQAGNRIVSYARDRQAAVRWFLGFVEPADSCETFYWSPEWELRLVLADGRSVVAEEIFATHGRADRMGPRIEILPGGTALRFSDFAVTFPAGERCMIWAGFPRSPWKAEEARALRIVHRSQAAVSRSASRE
ncbi:MAG: hypothetical protein GF330_02375 [Candidatus Eisenbacteria bacterium]|nr:hypothetical protein [Candidatus Eisenbacteria bacterium]